MQVAFAVDVFTGIDVNVPEQGSSRNAVQEEHRVAARLTPLANLELAAVARRDLEGLRAADDTS